MLELDAKSSESLRLHRIASEDAQKHAAQLQRKFDAISKSKQELIVHMERAVEEKKRLGRTVAELSCELEQKELELQHEHANSAAISSQLATAEHEGQHTSATVESLQTKLDEMSGVYDALFLQIQEEQSTSMQVTLCQLWDAGHRMLRGE